MSVSTLLVLVAAVLILLVTSRATANGCPVEILVSSGELDMPDSSGMGLGECEGLEHGPQGGGCWSLQQALDRIASSSDQDPSNCTTLRVHDGEHYLTSPVDFSSIEHISMIGVGSNVSIVCNYSKSHENGSIEYTWLFQDTASVILQNIEFYGCPYPFRMIHVQSVYVMDSSFWFFQEAVLDVFNCVNVTLSRLLLEHNYGTGIVLLPYRGNTGGIAIGFNGLPPDPTASPRVELSHSILRNNSALATSHVISISSTAFSQVFTGRGGALGVFVNDSYNNVSVTITNCSIEGNTARSFGGGAYFLFNGDTAQHSFAMDTTHFSSNVARLYGGGGVHLSFLSNGIPTAPHTVVFTDCQFHNNRAETGGGIYIFTSFLGSDGNYAKLERCVFSNNYGLGTESDYGAAMAISLLTIFRQRITVPRHEMVDCTFIRNRGENGIVSIGYAPMAFKGSNRFIENEGAAVRIVGAVVDVYDEVSFVNNTVPDLAQLYLLSFGQVRLKPGLNMTFQGNSGRFGASIQVRQSRTLDTFTGLMSNPRCFLLHHNTSLPPSQWTDVSITFTGNRATLGSSVYVSRLDRCSWFNTTSPFFNNTFLPDWPLWTFNNEENTGFNNSDDRAFSVGTTVKEIQSDNATVTAWPGQRIPLDIHAIDQFGRATTANIRFTFEEYSATMASFTPEIIIISPNSVDGLLHERFILKYALSGEVDSGVNTSLGEVLIHIPIETISVTGDRFVLNYIECPGGYGLERDRSTGLLQCECEETRQILHCEDDQDSVLIETGYWASSSDGSSSLQFLPCPSGYCGCSRDTSLGNASCINVYTNSDPDLQCVCNRKGVLCGVCRDGKGFSALRNKCVTCSDASGLLILLLIVVDLALLVGILLLDKPLPSWIYPFLFYMQLVPYVSQYFPGNFDTIGQYAYYLSSGLGFYFIYDFCLYGQMSSLVSHFLRFLPLFIAVIVRPALVAIRMLVRKYGKHMKSLHNHGLWWIVLLLYSPTVYVCMSVLSCFQLTTKDGNKKSIWFINGDVECFTGGHTPLALLAMLVLLFCFLFIPLCCILAMLKTSHKMLSKLNGTLHTNFKEEFRWWSSIELARRFVFLLFFMPFPRSTVGPIVVLILSISVYGFAKPYKERIANVLELVVQSCFLILLLLMSVASTQDSLLTFSVEESAGAKCSDRPDGVAGIAWLLFLVFYLPHGIFLVVGGSFLSRFIWEKYLLPRMKRATEDKDGAEPTTEPTTTDGCNVVRAHNRMELVISDHDKEGTATMSRINTMGTALPDSS